MVQKDGKVEEEESGESGGGPGSKQRGEEGQTIEQRISVFLIFSIVVSLLNNRWRLSKLDLSMIILLLIHVALFESV